MSRTILLLGIILMVAGLVAAGKQDKKGKKGCSKTEEYLSCGPNCPETCDNLGKKCGGKCKRGCFCRKGYVRDRKGKCVKASKQCCTKNEIFSKCAPNCEASCAEPTKKCEGCNMKCICKPGYVRTPKGKCINLNKCPPWRCHGDNETFLECGKMESCLPSCLNLAPPDICANVCTRGCYCNSGLVRDSEGFCVSPDKCPTLIECITNHHNSRK